jgi:hypothetical protein
MNHIEQKEDTKVETSIKTDDQVIMDHLRVGLVEDLDEVGVVEEVEEVEVDVEVARREVRGEGGGVVEVGDDMHTR